MLVNVIHCLADLSHENRACFFCKDELIVEYPVEQLAAVDSAEIKDFQISFNQSMSGGSLRSQFQDDADHFVVLERIIQLNDFRMLQAVHHFDLTFYVSTFIAIGNGDELRCQTQTRRFFFAFVNRSEFPSKQ